MTKTAKQKFNHSHADHHKPQRRRLTRRQKNLFHFVILLGIAATLLHEGGQMADWLFLSLALVVELS